MDWRGACSLQQKVVLRVSRRKSSLRKQKISGICFTINGEVGSWYTLPPFLKKRELNEFGHIIMNLFVDTFFAYQPADAGKLN